MSISNFYPGQPVHIISPSGHLIPSDDITYHIGAINRVAGLVSIQLLQDGRSVGAIDESKLQAK